jgi:molecular chaperone GrpE
VTPNDPHEPVTITDRRRIDPETGEVRESATRPAPSGAAGAAEPSDEAAELKATLQRVKAEYDNYRKRSVRQELAAADRAKVAVVSQLLGVLDDLDRARSHGDLESGPLRGVADKLMTALESVGLTAFGSAGDAFDPERHEAVQHEGDGTNPVVGSVLRRGYQMGDRVIRHAMVAVVDTDEPPAHTGEGDAESADTPDNDDVPGAQTAESASDSSTG